MLKYIIFDSLLIKKENSYAPCLASKWKIGDNGKVYEFFLRKGIKFHDGVELTSKDVKYTYELLKKVSGPNIDIDIDKNLVQNIISIDTPGPYSVRFILKKPSIDILGTVSTISILPEHIFKNVTPDKFENSPLHFRPIGTGPFKLIKWSKEEIILSANKEYFLGRPNLEKVIVRFFPNKEIAWAKIMSGEADLFFYLYPENYQFMTNNPNIKIYSFLDNYFYMLALNNKNPIFKNKEIRQAFNFALNKDEIIKTALSGHGVVSKGSVYPASILFDKELQPFPYDPSKALMSLKKYGWEDKDGDHFLEDNGKKFRFTVYILDGDTIFEKTALIMQKQFLDLGIEIKIKTLELDQIYEKISRKKEFEAAIVPFSMEYDVRFFHSNPSIGTFNIFSYSNSKIDSLLEQIQNTPDPLTKKNLYKEFQQELKKDPPGVFLFWRESMVALDSRFEGVDIGPYGILKNIRNWYVPKEKQKYR